MTALGSAHAHGCSATHGAQLRAGVIDRRIHDVEISAGRLAEALMIAEAELPDITQLYGRKGSRDA